MKNMLYDNFEKELDKSIWKPNMPWASDNAYAWHDKLPWMCFSNDCVSVQNGMLRLDVKHHREFCCGVVSTLQTFIPPVTIECRMKLGGLGQWGALWTFGTKGHHSEIDIVEQSGQMDFITNYHYPYKRCFSSKERLGQNPKKFDGDDQWHTYKLKWQKDRVTWYIDGELIRDETKRYVSHLFPKHQIIIGNGVQNPARTPFIELKPILINYIKVW